MDTDCIRILLVEDNPGDARLLEWYLSKPGTGDFQVRRAERLSDALRELTATRFDLVLLDLSLPDSSGMDTVRSARRAAGMTPIVVLTGLDDEETALAALRDGAQDYLVKGKFDNRELTRSLHYAIERERSEQALRQTKEALEAIIAASPAAVLSLDTAGRVVTWNESAEHIFGWTAAEAVGRIPRFVPAGSEAEFDALLKHVLAGKPVSDLEMQRQRKDGALIDVSLSASLIRGADGAASGTVAVLADITERKQARAEVEQKNAELAKLVEFKNLMLGMAAHDLRNPLAVVSAASSFLLDDAGKALSEAKKTDFIRRINANGEFMLKLIDDLLDVAKIESGQLDLELAAGDLCGLIEENLTMNRMLAEKKGIRLDFAPEYGLPLSRFDRRKVEQVLNNLVSNALKFSALGTVVTVQASRANGTVVVSVRDQGQGIPAKELDKLFKPFGTTSVRGTAGEKSTGLGLAICSKIIEAHHGRIWAESEPGIGSSFSFSLPVSDEDKS
jgi:PAS domain S-box-containing protein